jgi:alcohol dehydrogenase/propanol-preferring alcohol dehydrogenase
MATMLAFQVSRAKGPLELVERAIPEPSPGTVRVKVEACGVCGSDRGVVDGVLPGLRYPRVPGHEVIGLVDACGAGVTRWKPGQRVGVGWNGGYDGTCDPCRRGDFFACVAGQTTGVSFDGGYAQYMVAPVSALAQVPAELSSLDAAPLMCAGITTFNGLRRAGARPGDVVAVLGLGGLGHLAVQYAAKMGFRTVAVARGKDKASLAAKLGAHSYIDSDAEDVAAALGKLGGAKVIAATAPSGQAMSSAVLGLAPNGKLLVMGAPADAIQVPAFALIRQRSSIEGVYSGHAIDSEDTLAFSLLTNVRSMNEVFPFKEAPKAYERMLSGAARFRAVLDMNRP